MKSGEEQVVAINALNAKVAALEELLELYEFKVFEQAEMLMKKAEREKEANLKFHQSLIDTIPVPVFYKDIDGKYLGGNKAFAELVGLPMEELTGKNVSEILPQDQASPIHDSELKLLQKHGLQIDEISLTNDNGTCRDFVSFMSIFPAADGSHGGFMQALLDISERKRAEVALRESRQRSLDIIQFYPDATMVIDSGGKVVAWNLAMEELSGVRAEEMLGKGEYQYAVPFYGERRPILIDLVMKPDGELEKKFQRTNRHGNTIVGEAYVRNERGEQLYLQGTAAPLFNSAGEITGAIQSFRDLSERKRMEDNLRTVSCGIEQSPASIIIADREGNIEYVNPKFTRLTGYSSAEAVGQNPRILKSGKTPAEVHLKLWETVLSGGEWHGEFCNKKKNGELFWESASISPVADPEGNIIRFIAVKEDITERKRMEDERLKAEEALRESEERFRQIAEHFEEVIFLIPCDMSRMIYINPAYETIWQQSCRSLYERPLSFVESIHEEDRPRVITALEQLKQVVAFDQIYRIVRPDRTVRWIHARTYPVRGANGAVLRWVGIAADVTKQKLVEEHIRKLEQAVEQSPVSIVIADCAGNIEYVNPKFTRLTGYRFDEVSGRNSRLLKSGETPAEIYRQLWENISAGNEWHGEILNRKKNGELFWESVCISPIKNAAGEITHYLSVKEDISERKRMEEDLANRVHLSWLRAEIGGAFGKSQDLRGILQRCSELMVQYLDVAFFRIWTLNEAEQMLELQASAGLYAHINGPHGRVPVGMFKIGLIARERLLHFTNDVLNDPRIGDREWARREGMVAFAGYPLIVSDRLVGVMATFARTPLAEKILMELDTVAGRIAQCIESKWSDDALKEAKAFFESTLDSIIDIFYAFDVKGRLLIWNKTFSNISGYDDQELSSKQWRDFFSVADIERVAEAIEEIYEAGNAKVEADFISKEGRQILCEFNGSILKDGLGNNIGFSGTGRDITERKRAEEELRESRQQLLDIIQFYPDATMVIDSGGKVVAWNLAIEQMTGMRGEEMLGKGEYEYAIPFYGERRPILIDLVAKPDSAIEKRYQRTGWNGSTLIGEVYVENLRGEQRFLLGHAAPLYGSGSKIIGAIESIRDITERKRMEEDLEKARDAAEEANRLKSEFLANMSHEIRTPMNGVIGMTDLLTDTDLDQEQTEYVKAVKSSAESLLGVINDILDFSKIEEKKLDLELIHFGLRSNLGNILRTLAYRASEKGLELTLRFPSDVPDAVVGDPGRLRQVIVNLVSNAIKFTESGDVAVSVSSERDSEDEATLHFVVADTGIGVPEKKLKSIFEPFSQVDASTTRRYGGTGLGLTISARLVEMMGGRIWVESTVGRGSTFHFTVRFGLQKGLPVLMVPEEPGFLQELSVLVVDDNATNRGILAQMLKKWRMRPVTAENAVTALRMMAEARRSGDPFRLLLLDVNMPGMNGFELIERINKSEEKSGATIMMLTAVGQRGDAARCRELGISAYLTKPIGQSSLLDAILNVLGKTLPESARAPLVTVHSLREKQRPLRILLAEDNTVNQRVATRMLEKRGHSVTVAANGREAVAALRGPERGSFELVLMDVQMPEMDGFEATALIRGEEKSSGEHIPIIALTAHAMEGDRESCLRAGMDGYLSKPLKAEDLAVAMETVMGSRGLITLEAGGARRAEEGVFNHQEALARVDGDLTLLREVVKIFVEESPRQMAELREAIGAVDPLQMSRAAHALKGAIANFGARASFDAAHQLELMGKLGEMAEAPEFFAALEVEMERLQWSLTAFIGGTGDENTDCGG